MKRIKTAGSLVRKRTMMTGPLFGVFIALTLFTACASDLPAVYNGTVFKTVEPAFEFQLQDQFGTLVSLADHENKVVVLTFLYTNCPDVCPIITTQLKETFQKLSDVQDEVQFMAVSVDPDRDTISEAHDFLDKWGLVNDWSYLVGTQDQLEPIWKAYFVDPAINDRDTLQTGITPPPQPQASGVLGSLSQQITNTYLVIHSSPVFLIDRKGQRRVVLTSPLDPSGIAHDIRLLLND
jgi:protein SCO1/2